MNLDQLVEKFSAHKCYLLMGAGKMANQFKASIEDVVAAKAMVKEQEIIRFESDAKILIFDLETSPILAHV